MRGSEHGTEGKKALGEASVLAGDLAPPRMHFRANNTVVLILSCIAKTFRIADDFV